MEMMYILSSLFESNDAIYSVGNDRGKMKNRRVFSKSKEKDRIFYTHIYIYK